MQCRWSPPSPVRFDDDLDVVIERDEKPGTSVNPSGCASAITWNIPPFRLRHEPLRAGSKIDPSGYLPGSRPPSAAWPEMRSGDHCSSERLHPQLRKREAPGA